jgi:acyl carrier protein
VPNTAPRERLQKVFRATFEDATFTLDETVEAKDLPAWDSLKHITLILAIEEEFDVKFTTREVTSLWSVGRIVEALRSKVSNGSEL